MYNQLLNSYCFVNVSYCNDLMGLSPAEDLLTRRNGAVTTLALVSTNFKEDGQFFR